MNESHRQLDDTYRQLNSSYWDLQHELNASKVGAADLDNTRRAATLLGVATVFFVASTLYLIFRKPKEYW